MLNSKGTYYILWYTLSIKYIHLSYMELLTEENILHKANQQDIPVPEEKADYLILWVLASVW